VQTESEEYPDDEIREIVKMSRVPGKELEMVEFLI